MVANLSAVRMSNNAVGGGQRLFHVLSYVFQLQPDAAKKASDARAMSSTPTARARHPTLATDALLACLSSVQFAPTLLVSSLHTSSSTTSPETPPSTEQGSA